MSHYVFAVCESSEASNLPNVRSRVIIPPAVSLGTAASAVLSFSSSSLLGFGFALLLSMRLLESSRTFFKRPRV